MAQDQPHSQDQPEEQKKNYEDKPWGKVFIDGSVVIRDRREYVCDEDFSLEPNSLVGSWFHVFEGGQILWQGAVVGEPRPGHYLCEIDTLEEGASLVQRVFSVDVMLGIGEDGKRNIDHSIGEGKAPVIEPYIEWRFYDSEQQALEAWAQYAEHHAGTTTKDHDVRKEVE